MKSDLSGEFIHFREGFFLYCAILLAVAPIRWVFAALLGAVIHELCHIAAVKATGREIVGIEIGVLGTQIHVEMLSGWEEFLCLAAGPVGSLLLALTFRWLPLTACFSLIQGLFNLLPIVPLDGGRLLTCVLSMLLAPDLTVKIMLVIKRILQFLLFNLLAFAFIKAGIQ